MSYSIQTNVNSIRAQENLRVNGEFQSRTINRLTSGYRINSSSDDAAGLAVANKFRGDIAELNQGVRNANDGISTLEIVDGGLNNISTMLDRLRTLATQSASASFTGSRMTLNTEYQTLMTEINRQAANVGLGAAGTQAGRFNKSIDVYVGGSATAANAKLSVDLTGSRVDSVGLGLQGTNILGGTFSVADSTTVLNGSTAFLVGGAQVITFNYGAGKSLAVTVTGGATGISGQEAVNQINTQLSGTGITSMIDTNGHLGFYSDTVAFTTAAAAGTGTNALQTTASAISNVNMAKSANQAVIGATLGTAETVTVTVGSTPVTVALLAADTLATSLTKLNGALNSYGVYAVTNSLGTGIEFQSTSNFTYASTGAAVFTAGATASVTADPSSGTANSLASIAALQSAVTSLGAVQGKVGTGQNQMQYAVSLAQSQITSFSAAESRIRDTDVAAEAANLTKAQVLQQSSIAAMAQANSAPQAIMALLRG